MSIIMPSLKLAKGPVNQGQVFELTKDVMVLGRNPDCDIVLAVGAISREHAQVIRQGEDYYIKDLKSRNKTFLNDVEVPADRPMRLRHEDRIRICDFVCVFQDEDEPEKDEPTVMSTLLSQVGSALESQTSERLRVLLDITTKMSRALELSSLLPQILDSLFAVFKQADRGFVIFWDEQKKKYIPQAAKTRRGADEETPRFSRTILNKCLEEKQAFLCEDASADKNFNMSASISDFRIRSVMCAPLLTADDKVLGVIQLDTQDRVKHFTPDDLALLVAVANQAAIAMENSQLHENLVQWQKVQKENDLAKDVQKSFLPASLPEIKGYEFFAHYQAARQVGGDFYSFVELPDKRWVIGIGDVAGKGIPAALMMARFTGDMRFALISEADPVTVVVKLNTLMQSAGLADRFITFALVILDLKAHTLTVVNAGHVPPIIRRHSTGKLEEVAGGEFNGLPLGIMEDVAYEACTTHLNMGDSMILISDGILDAQNIKEEGFGLERFQKTIGGFKGTAHLLGQHLIRSVLNHATNPDQFDDMTLVCFGRTV
jgi:serine phosphatase RsbU (regulator of sigma subunit)